MIKLRGWRSDERRENEIEQTGEAAERSNKSWRIRGNRRENKKVMERERDIIGGLMKMGNRERERGKKEQVAVSN